jgi:DNA polymerase III alpha subunit
MVHLHVHSHFSFGIGVSSPEVLAAAAAQRGLPALACTDTNGVYGVIEFQRACDAAGVRPILGAHLVTEDEEAVALATDERGWATLCRAITVIHWSTVTLSAQQRAKGAKPNRSRVTAHSLSTHLATDRDGLILLSADPGFLERIIQQSGPRDLYAELIPGKERHAVLAAARRLELPAVATNGVVMAHPEDWARHRLLRAIALNTTLSELEVRPRHASRDAWLRPTPDLARHFPDCPDALRAAAEIAERCRYRIPEGRIVPPRLADGADAFQRLRALAY